MVTIDDFSRLVSGIYAAAVTPEHWEVAIREIHRTLGGTAGSLVMADRAVWSILDSTLPVAAVTSYAEHYCHLDHVLAAVKKGPVGAVRTGTELVAPYRNSEFYAGWLQPNELGDGLLVQLTGRPRRQCFIVAAPPRTESFATPERVKLMSGLVPHLQQALRTQNHLAELMHRCGALAEAAEVVRHGIVIVEPGPQIVHLNAAADRILRSNDGLHIHAGRIEAADAPANRELHRSIHNALTQQSTPRIGNSLTCARPSGQRPYVIHVLPLHRTSQGEPFSDTGAIVVIINPEREPEPAAALLRRLYGLTNSEAEVALLVSRGDGLKPIADELSLSWTTIRTHLNHIFDKTDTHRQAELVRLLLAIDP